MPSPRWSRSRARRVSKRGMIRARIVQRQAWIVRSKAATLTKRKQSSQLALMQTIKAAMDPQNALGTGIFLVER